MWQALMPMRDVRKSPFHKYSRSVHRPENTWPGGIFETACRRRRLALSRKELVLPCNSNVMAEAAGKDFLARKPSGDAERTFTQHPTDRADTDLLTLWQHEDDQYADNCSFYSPVFFSTAASKRRCWLPAE